MSTMCANWHSAPAGATSCPRCGAPIIGFDTKGKFTRDDLEPMASCVPPFVCGGGTAVVEAPVTVSAPAPAPPVVTLARELSTLPCEPPGAEEIYGLLEQDNLAIGARRRFRFRRGD